MKTENQDLGKLAWFSRVTAPVLILELEVRIRNLPKKDLLSQADGFCVLWKVPNGYTGSDADGTPAKEPSKKEEEIGRTEVSRSCINPVFIAKFRLKFIFHKEQTYLLRVYDEDLRYATGLSEHDYLGGFIFTLGQVMGAKGCSLAKRLRSNDRSATDACLIVTGKGVVENREVLEFRFSCQDLIQQQNIVIDKIDRSKVIDKCRPYFRLERLNMDDQSWEIVWKSEVRKQTLDPVWNEARLPLQLLCNDDQDNPLKISIWDYEKGSIPDVIVGSVETSVAAIVEKSKDGGIPVFIVKREKQKLFGRTKLKHVGLLKVLNATVITVPSMLQYVSGGMSLDLMIGIDCSTSNGQWGSEDNLHFSADNWLNDYQAGIQNLGKIAENFSRGSYSSILGLGAEINGEYRDCYPMKERLCTGKDLLKAYNDNIVNNSAFYLGEKISLNPLIKEAIFRTIKLSKMRPCYTVLAIFIAGDFEDLDETVDLICRAAEDAPISIVIIGVGNSDFSSVKQLCGQKNWKLRDSRGIPIAREIVTFVSFKQFGGNATEVIAEALKEIPEQFVEYQVINGVKPLPPVPAPDFEKMTASSADTPNKRNNRQSSRKRNERRSKGSHRTKNSNRRDRFSQDSN